MQDLVYIYAYVDKAYDSEIETLKAYEHIFLKNIYSIFEFEPSKQQILATLIFFLIVLVLPRFF